MAAGSDREATAGAGGSLLSNRLDLSRCKMCGDLVPEGKGMLTKFYWRLCEDHTAVYLKRCGENIPTCGCATLSGHPCGDAHVGTYLTRSMTKYRYLPGGKVKGPKHGHPPDCMTCGHVWACCEAVGK